MPRLFKRFRSVSASKRRCLAVTPPDTFREKAGRVVPDIVGVLEEPLAFPPSVFDPKDPFDQTLLGLALAFNDLRDCMWVTQQVHLGTSKEERLDGYDGTVRGMHLWVGRLTIGLLHEVLTALEERSELLTSDRARAIEEAAITNRARAEWQDLLRLALNPDDERRQFLLRVRNALSFHYHSPKVLARGFERHFRTATPGDYSQYLYASIGESIAGTRFLFADAAAQAASANTGAATMGTEDFARIDALAADVAKGLWGILVAYIGARAQAIEQDQDREQGQSRGQRRPRKRRRS